MVALHSHGRSVRKALVSRTTLTVFGFLALGSALPMVVDIYASPVYWVLFTPPYIVTMVLYDGVLGLEAVVYPLAEVLPVDGHLLWEAGRIATLYLFSVAVGWVVARFRGPSRPQSESESAGS